jgi:hypothetical protein
MPAGKRRYIHIAGTGDIAGFLFILILMRLPWFHFTTTFLFLAYF